MTYKSLVLQDKEIDMHAFTYLYDIQEGVKLILQKEGKCVRDARLVLQKGE